MSNILESLTKEDLIKVIGNMHDLIQDWNVGYGLSKEESDTLINVGSACTKHCAETNFDLPKIVE
jgi:hypothetical protein